MYTSIVIFFCATDMIRGFGRMEKKRKSLIERKYV